MSQSQWSLRGFRTLYAGGKEPVLLPWCPNLTARPRASAAGGQVWETQKGK